MDMEINQPGHRRHDGLAMVADMLNHRSETSLNVAENLRDLVQASFNCAEPRRRRLAAAVDCLTWCWQPAAPEHRVKVLRFPAERYRQRFQGPRATAALNGVALNFPNDRGRHMRAFRKFALTPSKLSHAFIDGLSDGCPILRHSIPPRSALGAEVSGSARFGGTPRSLDRRGPAQESACQAEIIEISLKSALLLVGASASLGHRRNDS
jgi:hypothetical protein